MRGRQLFDILIMRRKDFKYLITSEKLEGKQGRRRGGWRENKEYW